MFELLESFGKQIVPPVTEHDDVIETQTKNCMHSQIAHAKPLLLPHNQLNLSYRFEFLRKLLFGFSLPASSLVLA